MFPWIRSIRGEEEGNKRVNSSELVVRDFLFHAGSLSGYWMRISVWIVIFFEMESGVYSESESYYWINEEKYIEGKENAEAIFYLLKSSVWIVIINKYKFMVKCIFHFWSEEHVASQGKGTCMDGVPFNRHGAGLFASFSWLGAPALTQERGVSTEYFFK